MCSVKRQHANRNPLQTPSYVPCGCVPAYRVTLCIIGEAWTTSQQICRAAARTIKTQQGEPEAMPPRDAIKQTGWQLQCRTCKACQETYIDVVHYRLLSWSCSRASAISSSFSVLCSARVCICWSKPLVCVSSAGCSSASSKCL